ncbi:hypothetical protein PHLGIDRAFT_127707 [Phlebiopsis gigantea 11061_1 CR5-6]|uniref:Uncharacterized protein n=1 Tax=Phlebiopsis gigantea (strain 11061_1 CR5-6) TaxID=745531 RepID=A0A0C3NQC7_PHLG1|nr:hypothetical protein PHLGIDRAFT_127707 [Phlebiopsis gigantea 11061_1 CR5-6]
MACSLSLEVPTIHTAPHVFHDDDDDLASRPPLVQFDDTCVVIPDPVAQSRMPRLIKKSYSLPLWRRTSPSNRPPDAVQTPSSPEDKSAMSITVSVPSFARSRSPTRGEHVHQPLVSSLLNGEHPAPRRPARRPSLPLPPPVDAATLPLRPCCRECYPITEECLKEGVVWTEKFTRGARRRRNSSAETHAHAHTQRHRRVCDDVPGFGAVVLVDEVDHRWGTSSVAPASAPRLQQPGGADAGLLPSFSRRLNVAESSTATTAAIAEEAEDDAHFPLPSSSSRAPPLFSPSASAALSSSPLTFGHDELSRSSVYFTPDASPAISPWDVEGSSSGSDSPTSPGAPITPPQTFARSIPIPSAKPSESVYTDASLSSFELVQSPASPSQLSTSPGARRKQFMHMPHLPSAGSLLRAGADIFRGVSVIGSGGPMPLSV